MDQFKTILNPVNVRKETNMIINENNKNSILKGTVKRGFNQDPNELREKLYQNTHPKPKQPEKTDKPKDIQKNVREIFNKLRKLK